MGYCIYMHINKINNKIYIGQTKFTHNPNARWQSGEGYKANTSFYEDIQQYGWDNFIHKVLETDLTVEQANEKEHFYISAFQSTNPDKGYNKTSGGGNVAFRAHPSSSPSATPIGYNDANGILRSRKEDIWTMKERQRTKYERYYGEK